MSIDATFSFWNLLHMAIVAYLLWSLFQNNKLGKELSSQQTPVRKVAYLVHVQGRTESDEHMDFAVSLFEDESEERWKSKLAKAFELREERLAFQNKRVMELMKPAEEPTKE